MNYLKYYIRKTKTKYNPTFKGILFKTLKYPIYLSDKKIYQKAVIDRFFQLKYGMNIIERMVIKLFSAREI